MNQTLENSSLPLRRKEKEPDAIEYGSLDLGSLHFGVLALIAANWTAYDPHAKCPMLALDLLGQRVVANRDGWSCHKAARDGQNGLILQCTKAVHGNTEPARRWFLPFEFLREGLQGCLIGRELDADV